ncbi:hypothetical protein DICPUDRAFT_12134, partial [Dictyostelium purpureum]
LFFSLLYSLFPVLLNIATKYFNIKLSDEQKIDWVNRFVSTVNAVITSAISIIALLNASEWVKHPFYSTCDMSNFVMKFISFYFVFDTAQTVFYYKALFSWQTIFHHFIALGGFFFIGLIRQEAHFLILYYSFSECTTPFVNLRKHLYDLELQNTILYKVNGMIMAIGFVTIRVFFITYSIWELYHRGLEIPYFTNIFFYTVYPSITCLNFYWTFLIVKGIIKALSKKKD